MFLEKRGMSGRCSIVIGAMLVCTAVLSAAQGLTDAAFEAATMQRNVSGVENWSLNPRPTGQFTVTNGRVSDIVQAAFLIQDYQLEGLPAWTRSERYDIVAKLDASPPDRAMWDAIGCRSNPVRWQQPRRVQRASARLRNFWQLIVTA